MKSETDTVDVEAPVGLKPYSLRVDGLIEDNAKARPNDEALREGGLVLSWSEFDERVSESARHFLRAGLKEGDRVAFLVSNSIDAYVTIFGAMRAGAVIAPISTMLSADDVARLVVDAGARTIVVSEEYESLVEASHSSGSQQSLPPWCRLGEEAISLGVEAHASYVDGACSIIYSSGTTGLPKGAVHSHDARIVAGQNAAIAFSMHSGSRALVSTPPYTNGSWMIILPALATGACIFLSRGFEVERFLATCSEWGPTHAFIVPTQFQLLFDSGLYRPELMESFSCMITAGAPMPPAMKARLMAELPDRLYELWGLTEVAATVIRPDEMLQRPDSVGRALPLSEFRLIDESGSEVAKPGIGEIVARSRYQMARYWGGGDLNEGIRWESEDGKSFMRTGDIGEFDELGYLYIRGRVKDMIISGGLNVFPIDIENTLRTNDAVTDAAVIGVPDPKWGEVPVAFVRSELEELDTDGVREWANGRLSKFQRLQKVVHWRSDFPRNTLGKVLKRELVEVFMASANAEER
ncbi:class I adenylate-forming enzyme family protein [Pseudohaliea sp.]|uniref:class I adenylate-forming enzyme family protein n=1 Tax=Pseudohaliea sp. TaxID=2740289 RepID=UPI0032EC28FD